MKVTILKILCCLGAFFVALAPVLFVGGYYQTLEPGRIFYTDHFPYFTQAVASFCGGMLLIFISSFLQNEVYHE